MRISDSKTILNQTDINAEVLHGIIANLEKSIMLGNAIAMNSRATMHSNGLGGEVNYKAAISLYDQAIKLGNSCAMNNRAYMHTIGLGDKMNYLEALGLYHAAHKKGHLLDIKDQDLQGPQSPLRPYHQFMHAIHVLKVKMYDFELNSDYETNPKLKSARDAAKTLHDALSQEGYDYFQSQLISKEDSKEDYDKFKERCENHIAVAARVLNQHRGWAKILVNIFAFIASLGYGYAIAAGINTALNKGKCTFFATDSSAKLDEIAEHIENMGSNCPGA